MADLRSINDSDIVSSETDADCPDIEFSLTYLDGSAFDSTVFTFNATAQTLTTETNDELKIDVYDFRLTAKYAGAQYTNTGILDFTIDVIDPCLELATLTAQS